MDHCGQVMNSDPATYVQRIYWCIVTYLPPSLGYRRGSSCEGEKANSDERCGDEIGTLCVWSLMHGWSIAGSECAQVVSGKIFGFYIIPSFWLTGLLAEYIYIYIYVLTCVPVCCRVRSTVYL